MALNKFCSSNKSGSSCISRQNLQLFQKTSHVAFPVPRQMCSSFIDSFAQVAGVGLLLLVTPEMFAKIAALGKVPVANVTLVGSETGVGPFVDLHFATVAEKLLADVALKSPEVYIIFFHKYSLVNNSE
jgi:hypothetical protein